MLVYVLFAIFVSTITEVISATFRLRSAALETSFARLLEDPPGGATTTGGGAPSARENKPSTRQMFGLFRLPKALAASRAFSLAGNLAPLAGMVEPAALKRRAGQPLRYTDVFNHPLVAGTQRTNRPAYVSGGNFTSALLFALRGAATGAVFSDIENEVRDLPEGSLKSVLVTLIREAGGDLAALRSGIARWYDSSMDRLSGDYKRFAQWITFWVGLTLAVACNVDTIRMVGRLYAEPALRTSMSKAAETYVNAPHATPPVASASLAGGAPETGGDVAAKIAGAQQAESLLMRTVPIGWTAAPSSSLAWMIALLGWLVTALAGVLGAPFWFDLLQKLVNVRNTGPKPRAAAAAA